MYSLIREEKGLRNLGLWLARLSCSTDGRTAYDFMGGKFWNYLGRKDFKLLILVPSWIDERGSALTSFSPKFEILQPAGKDIMDTEYYEPKSGSYILTRLGEGPIKVEVLEADECPYLHTLKKIPSEWMKVFEEVMK